NLGNAISWHSFSCCKSPENISELVIEDVPSVSILKPILMHMCGRPRGLLGRLGGHIMARTNAECGAWVSDLLQIASNDSVLEIGIALTRCVTIRKTTIAHATLVFFLLGRSDLRLFFVGHGCLRRLLCLASVLHVVRRRLDLACHEAVNPLGP